MPNDQPQSRDGEEPVSNEQPLPGPVQEAIDSYGRYYAEHHKLGMSVRKDMTYIAQMAMRWKPDESSDELAKERTKRETLEREIGFVRLAYDQLVARHEQEVERAKALPAQQKESTVSEIAPAMAIAEAQRESDLKLFAQWAKDVELPFGETLESRHTFSIAYEDYVRACPIEHSVLRGERQGG